ncbi:plasmid maintenance system antidote protein VapI [Paenibacillus forsythiae]|uniref:Plasmid maintenance system antidote protein VapI n=1 Tax=Paenibacillus forsythiae TaxID=365616 RepID=A0ABU3H6Q9_9BACL|nr:helix-turn-helix transcriptional regulator [Paenibacillus forsythiae]MDT3426136.1 plasmid maintenance system antidote protein VapI [Paenibacillus forsythiae]
MRSKKPITPYGWTIKQRLAELKLSQKDFCHMHGIPPSRLSNLIHGTRIAMRYRRQVNQLLDITANVTGETRNN